MAERAVQLEPLDEASQMLLMQAYADSRSIQGVVDTYNQFASMLAKELGCSPSAAVRSLFERLTGA